MPLETCLNVAAAVLYPGVEGVIHKRALPVESEGVVPCCLHFNEQVLAFGSLLAVEENGWLLMVHAYVSAQGHQVPSRAWALEQPAQASASVFRIRSMVPAGPVPIG